MIEDIYRIGSCTQSKQQRGQLDEELMPDTSVVLDGIIGICLDKDGGYVELRYMEGSRDILPDILLKRKASNGPNYSPTALIAKEFSKTLSKRIIGWFKVGKKGKGNKKESDSADEGELLYTLYENIYKNLTLKAQNIIKAYENLKLSKGTYALTVIYDNRLPKNVPFILNRYVAELHGKTQGVGTGTCSLCNKPDKEIIPKSDVFKFFTVDKPGNISGGFNEDRVWMNYPVCRECEKILARGKAYVWDNLGFNFYGLHYYLIPSVRSLSSVAELKELLEDITKRKITFEEKSQKSIQYSEDEICDILTNYNDINSFHLLFMKTEQAAERILLEIKDVYPSRIQKIFGSKKNMDARFGLEDPGFNFHYIRRFLLKSDKNNRDNDLDKLFLDITRSIFLQEKIDFKTLLPHFMREIRYDLENNSIYAFADTAKAAMISFEYLCDIKCINR